jgi:hypothetical protein
MALVTKRKGIRYRGYTIKKVVLHLHGKKFPEYKVPSLFKGYYAATAFETVAEAKAAIDREVPKTNPNKIVKNPTPGFYKMWFSGPGGNTADLILDNAKYPIGKTSVSTYSRFFPVSEARKMTRLHISKVYSTWDEAFHSAGGQKNNPRSLKEYKVVFYSPLATKNVIHPVYATTAGNASRLAKKGKKELFPDPKNWKVLSVKRV